MKMPLFNYPSTVVWLDDSELFIRSIDNITNDLNSYNVKTFTNPLECLDFIKKSKFTNFDENFLLACKNYEESDLVDHAPADIDFSKIILSLENQRNEEISVIIVDQNMPEMNGIELCKHLQNLPVKKILLTGFITEDEVIKAFNEKIIDCYIKKGTDTFIDEINLHIRLLSEKYFIEKSSPLLSFIETDKKLHFSDDIFIAFFAEWCKANRIIEYCLIDKIGNMRVIDDQGFIRNFVIYNHDTLGELIELNNLADEPNAFLEVISSKRKIPFFGERKNGWDIAAAEWDKHLYPCQVINGRTDYYWCAIDSKKNQEL